MARGREDDGVTDHVMWDRDDRVRDREGQGV